LVNQSFVSDFCGKDGIGLGLVDRNVVPETTKFVMLKLQTCSTEGKFDKVLLEEIMSYLFGT